MYPSSTCFAIRYNNSGAHSIERGRFEEAIITLSWGLEIAKQTLAFPEYRAQESQYGTRNQRTDALEIPSCQFIKFQEPVAKDLSVSGETFRQDEPFIFRSPIILPPRAAQPQCSKSSFKALSFIILYNLALAHHLSATRNKMEPIELEKALIPYKLAYTIHIKEGLRLSAMQSMAIVNNLGQIHTALNDEDQSTECFQNLLSTIMILYVYGEQDAVDDLEGFLGNVMPLIVRHSSAPVA